ncbi:Protein of unknown function DUF3632 [Penicillium samsonianum]|uniref:Protein of unknown function DUF3632 n=1 Tax=Penicillium samsonianum TaxID=1882272 RepID=UPI002547DB5B|nr:Protein of unknown function DUF3632 [Penicillium samsonianum]KAJ6128897.1 Protein of unknown function DUF3632 [Penicillium samsonianum]
MAAPLRLRLVFLEREDLWIFEQNYFLATKAAAGINELTPVSREAKGEEVEYPESWCLEFWGTVSDIMKQIPHDHPLQDKMVETIKELEDLPGVEVTFYETVLGVKRSCSDSQLTCLSFYAGNNANLDRSSTFDRSINWQAFSARVLQASLADWFHLTNWCFRDALKEEPLQPKEFVGCRICVAVQWIRHSGETIFHSIDNIPYLRDLRPGPPQEIGLFGKQDSVS